MVSSLKKKKGSKKGTTSKEDEKALIKAKSLSETKNWYQDRYQMITVQRNSLLYVTLLALFGLGAAVYAVGALNASRTFEPYVIEIEDKTGVVTQVDQTSLEIFQANDAVVKSFLVKYLKSRETYDIADYSNAYYNIVRLFSSPSVYSMFRGFINASNPDSPLNLADKAIRRIEIKVITFLAKGKVQIRFATKEYAIPTMQLLSTTHYQVTLDFGFFALDLSQADRYVNPLGFQVTSYRRDVEQVFEEGASK